MRGEKGKRKEGGGVPNQGWGEKEKRKTKTEVEKGRRRRRRRSRSKEGEVGFVGRGDQLYKRTE